MLVGTLNKGICDAVVCGGVCWKVIVPTMKHCMMTYVGMEHNTCYNIEGIRTKVTVVMTVTVCIWCSVEGHESVRIIL